MNTEMTGQQLFTLVENLKLAFESVSLQELTEEDWDTPQTEEGVRVDYELHCGQINCLLTRRLLADGRSWQLRIRTPLAGGSLPEERLTERDRELFRDDMNHDFLSGAFNRRYLETRFANLADQWGIEGRQLAVALISIDQYTAFLDSEHQDNLDQLICFVANQWKKTFFSPEERVICRFSGGTFVVGSVDTSAAQLAEEMRQLYAQMPKECVTGSGRFRVLDYTLTVACADNTEVADKSTKGLYDLCDRRRRAAVALGGDRVVSA